MKSAVETLSPTRAKLTVEVPFEELKPSLDAAYKKIAQQINVPGFRRGKVPPMVIDRQVGRGAVLDEAINEALPKLYVEALQANDLEPLAQPEIEITKFEDNETLEFTAEVDIRPEIDAARLHRPRGHGRRRRGDRPGRRGAGAEPPRALREPHRGRAAPRPTATSWSSTSSPARTARSSRAPRPPA